MVEKGRGGSRAGSASVAKWLVTWVSCPIASSAAAIPVTDLIEQGAPAYESAIPFLSQLLKAELAEREVRSIAYHMKSARFPAYKDLSGFDFAASEINEATVRTLHRCEFMDDAHNVVLIGGPGTGKTQVSIASRV